ncbi:MAG: hypothetical protein ACOYOE_08050 [Chlorobium sp.]
MMAAPEKQSTLQEHEPDEAQVLGSSSKVNARFFEDDNRAFSSLRMMCMVSLISAIVFGLLTFYLSLNGINDGGNGIYFTLVSLVGAFAPKTIRKAELKESNK